MTVVILLIKVDLLIHVYMLLNSKPVERQQYYDAANFKTTQ